MFKPLRDCSLSKLVLGRYETRKRLAGSASSFWQKVLHKASSVLEGLCDCEWEVYPAGGASKAWASGPLPCSRSNWGCILATRLFRNEPARSWSVKSRIRCLTAKWTMLKRLSESEADWARRQPGLSMARCKRLHRDRRSRWACISHRGSEVCLQSWSFWRSILPNKVSSEEI